MCWTIWNGSCCCRVSVTIGVEGVARGKYVCWCIIIVYMVFKHLKACLFPNATSCLLLYFFSGNDYNLQFIKPFWIVLFFSNFTKSFETDKQISQALVFVSFLITKSYCYFTQTFLNILCNKLVIFLFNFIQF